MKIKVTMFVLLILIAGCATPPPTKEEIANLDYGSCPTGYEEQIKSHFKSGFLTAY